MADTVQANNDVFYFTNVILTLRGGDGAVVRPPVSAITIDLRENGLPEIECIIDPAHEDLQADLLTDDAIPDATPVTMSSARFYHQRIQDLAIDPQATADLTFNVHDGTKSVQAIELKDWIIGGGGMSGLSAAGGFALLVQLQHPVARLDMYVGSLGEPIEDGWAKSAESSVGDIITCLGYLYKKWALATRKVGNDVAQNTADSGCIVDGLRFSDIEASVLAASKNMQQMATVLTDNVEFVTEWPNNAAGYSKWPFSGAGNCLANLSTATRAYTLLAYVTAIGQSSPWETFSTCISNDFFLVVVPTYWKKLEIVPFTPWGNPVITLYDDQIADVNFPALDPAPVSGAKVVFTGPLEDYSDTVFQDYSGSDTVMGSVLYMPEATRGADAARYANGRVYVANMPSWFGDLVRMNAASATPLKADNDGVYDGTGTLPPNANPQVATASETARNLRLLTIGAASRMAKQVFLMGYRSEVEVSFKSCLLIQSESSAWKDGYVIPGCVVRVMARDTGKAMFDFYLKRIVHTISVPTHQATTEWMGTYVRNVDDNGKGGITGMAENGTWNPIYK